MTAGDRVAAPCLDDAVASHPVDPGADLRDDALMARLARGETEALRDLMAAHGATVLNVAYRLTRDVALAQDVTQETFLRALERAATYQRGRGARAWLVTIARNLALNGLRRLALEARPLPPAPARADDPHAALATKELAREIEDALARIDEPFRSAVVLCAVEGLSYTDAAVACGCSPKTLGSRLARARARFRELMARYLDPDGGEGEGRRP